MPITTEAAWDFVPEIIQYSLTTSPVIVCAAGRRGCVTFFNEGSGSVRIHNTLASISATVGVLLTSTSPPLADNQGQDAWYAQTVTGTATLTVVRFKPRA